MKYGILKIIRENNQVPCELLNFNLIFYTWIEYSACKLPATARMEHLYTRYLYDIFLIGLTTFGFQFPVKSRTYFWWGVDSDIYIIIKIFDQQENKIVHRVCNILVLGWK